MTIDELCTTLSLLGFAPPDISASGVVMTYRTGKLLPWQIYIVRLKTEGKYEVAITYPAGGPKGSFGSTDRGPGRYLVHSVDFVFPDEAEYLMKFIQRGVEHYG